MIISNGFIRCENGKWRPIKDISAFVVSCTPEEKHPYFVGAYFYEESEPEDVGLDYFIEYDSAQQELDDFLQSSNSFTQ